MVLRQMVLKKPSLLLATPKQSSDACEARKNYRGIRPQVARRKSLGISGDLQKSGLSLPVKTATIQNVGKMPGTPQSLASKRCLSGKEQFRLSARREEDEKAERTCVREYFLSTEQHGNQAKGPFPDGHQGRKETAAMTKFKLSAALALALLAIILIYQNTAPTEVRFLFITLEMPRAALLTMVLLAGIALGILISLVLVGRFPEKKGEDAGEKEVGRQEAEP
jgi:uncharacterized integral membrane protein